MARAPERWRLGGRIRGAQFKTVEALLPFKCTYPVHLTDAMDISPPNQGDLFRSNFVSPIRGTRTRAVREYEQTIDELKKENFDLKLRIYLLEEGITKTLINQGCPEDPNNVVRVIVDLQVQAEELKNVLTKKAQLLQETSEIVEKYENDLRESNLKVKELQEQNESLLQKLQELPSKNEVQLLLDERTNLLDENANINFSLSEKEASLSELQAQLENLTVEKNALENKVKKSSLAIQGIVYKYHKDTQNIPKDIRQVVQSAVQAAKDSNKAEVIAAVEAFNASLFEILSISSDETTSSASPHEDNKENASQKDSMEEFQRSLRGSQSSENLVQTSKSSHPKSKNELNPKTSSEYLSASSSKSRSSSREELEQMVEVTSENLVLKVDVQEKTRLIEEQVAQITELERRVTQLQKEISESVSKYRDIELKYIEERSKATSSVPMRSTAAQCRSEMSDKLLQTSELIQSDSIDDLREESLRLSLVIEEKDKEIIDLKEQLSQVLKISDELSKNVDMDLNPKTSSDNLSANMSGRENLHQVTKLMAECLVRKIDVKKKTRRIEEQVAQITELEQKVTQQQKEISESVPKYRDIELKHIEERSKSPSFVPISCHTAAQCRSEVSDKLMQTSKLMQSDKLMQTSELMQSDKLMQTSELMQSDKLMQTSELMQSDKLMQTSELMQSDSIDDLREESLRLSLVIEEKDKEIADLKETLSKVEIRPADKSTNVDMEYLNERDELHQKLADCSAVNHDLLKHLKSLETFMENLLLNKTMDSSIDSSNEASNYLSQLTSCLDQTLRLSTVLSDHLSVCEGSKIFDPSDLTMNIEYNPDIRTSLPLSDHSHVDVSTTTDPSIRGRNKFKLSDRDILKHTSGTGKRRLSFSNSQNSDMGSENLVYLGTSNNEDLLLLLNERGDPKDVLIRNSQEKVLPPFNDGPQRRYWDPLGTNQWKAENNPFGQHISNWHASQLMNSGKFGTWHNHCPSSDSDIWSEPDREVSSQRIGIDVQKSPIAQKSPRRSRVKGRSTDEHSSHVNESSSGILKILPLSKRRRCSDSSRSSNICKKCMLQSHQTPPSEESGFEAVIKVLEGKLSQYEAECKRLRNELSESNSENHALKQTVRDMEQELSQHDVQCEQLLSEMSETRSKLISFEAKCSELENKLSLSCKDKEEWEICLKASEDEKQKLASEMESLVSDKNELLQSVHLEKQAKENAEREKYLLSLNLREGENKCEQLQSELNETKFKLTALDSKCSELESKLTLSTKSKEECEKHLKVSESEKQKLVSEIENLLESVNVEKQTRESLEKEKRQLNADLSNKENTITSLQASIKSSEEKAISFLREKEVLENKLLSFNSSCNELKEELSRVKGQLEDMQLKCSTYKKELNKASTFKQEVNDKLSSLISEFVPNVNNLKNVCNHYLNLRESVPNLMEPNFDLVSDKDAEIKNQLEIIVSANVILEQKISLLSEAIFRSKSKENVSDVLNSVQHELKMKEEEIKQLESQNQLFRTKMDDCNSKLKNYKISNDELKLQAETYHQELYVSRKESQLLQDQSQELQNVIKDLQRSIEEKDTLMFSNKMEETSLLKQVSTLQNQIENYKHQIIQNDEEITKLQERIFNVQTQLNCLLTEKANSTTQTEMKSIVSTATGSKEVLVPSREIGVDSKTLIQYRTTGSGSKEVLVPSREIGVDSDTLIQYRTTGSGSKEVLVPSMEIGVDSENLIQYRTTGSGSKEVLVPSMEIGVDSENLIQYRTTGSGSKEVLVPSMEIGVDSENLIQFRTTGSGSKEVLVPSKEVGVDSRNLVRYRAIGSGSKEVLTPSREVGVDSGNLVEYREVGVDSGNPVEYREVGVDSGNPVKYREVGVDSGDPVEYREAGVDSGNPVEYREVGVDSGNLIQYRAIGSGSKEILTPSREVGVDSESLIQYRTTASGSKEVLIPSRDFGLDSVNLVQYKEIGLDSENLVQYREVGVDSWNPIQYRTAGSGSKEVLVPSREVALDSKSLIQYRTTGSGSKEVLISSREVDVDSKNLVPHKEAGSGSNEALVPSRSMGSGSQEILIPSREVAVDSENLIQYRTSGVGSREVLMHSREVGVEPERYQYREIGSGSREVLVPTREIGINSQPLIQYRTTGIGSKEVILPSREVGVDSKTLIQFKDTGSDSKRIESNELLIPTRETGTGSKEVLVPFRNIGSSSKEVFISSRDAGIGSEEVLKSAEDADSRYFYSDAKRDTVDLDQSYNSSISDTEKTQVKKINAISAKLDYYKKRIEVLAKEKNDLREELMVQIEGNRRASKLSTALDKELSDTKSKLEAKTSFVKDLKKELQNSYNLLIEKEKEVDELYKQKNEISAAKTKLSIQEAFEKKFSDPFHLKTESNISDLKKHKWDLVKEIFKLQKQFYEKKNIHLKHFEKFKSHIEKLRALQASFQKSGSEPMLNTSLPASCGYVEKYDRPLHFLQIELELDVEYLQNFKIFLKRFFIPVTLQKCTSCSEFDPKNDSSTAKPSLNAEKESLLSANKGALKLNLENPTSMELLHSSSDSTTNRLVQAASVISHKVASLENLLRSLKFQFSNLNVLDSLSEEKKSATKSVLAKIESDLNIVEENAKQICELNSLLKSLNMSLSYVPTSPNKDMSDRESVLSEETITLSRSGSLSPMSSFEEHFPTKLSSKQNAERCKTEEELPKGMKEKQTLRKPNPVGGSLESIIQRSHFSSPDLGIESDPNHEGSAPEQAEIRDSNSRKWLDISSKGKHMSADMNTNTELIGDFSRIVSGESLHSVGLLQHYKLLKKEIQESLVGIKIILSRTKDVLQHADRFASPRKNIESTTFKAIKDESQNIEICLQEAAKLVNNFWIAPCPSEKDLKTLVQLNQDLQSQIVFLQESKKKQQISFEQAMEKLKVAEDMRDKIEKNISRKLLKTKKVMREVENKMLHKRNEAQLPFPKFPSERPHQTEK